MRKLIFLLVAAAMFVCNAPLFAQMVPPTLDLPVANDTAVSTSPLLQTANHGDARIEFEVDSVSTFNSPGKMVAISLPNNWGDKEQGRVTFLKFNKKYYWRGRSAMDGDTSSWSSTRNFRTTAYPILQYPANNSTNGLSAFGWKDAGSLTYTVQLDTTADFSSPFAQNINISDTVFPKYGTIYAYAEKLIYGKKHYWRVKAYHKNDTSAWSPVWNFTLPSATTLKSPATNTVNLPDNPKLEWNRLWDAQFYQLEYDTTADFSSAIKKDTLQKGTSSAIITLNNLYFGSKYYWRVRAVYAGDTSAWTDVWNFSTVGKVTLSSPYNNKTDLTLDNYVSWYGIGSGTHNYEVQIDSTNTFNSPHLYKTITPYNAKLQGRMFGTTYYWRVRVVNMADSSGWSDVWKFTTVARQNGYNLIPTNNAQNQPLSVEFTIVNFMAGNKSVIELDTSVNFDSPILRIDTLLHKETENYPRKKINNLRFGQKYYWRTKTFNGSDSTNWALPYTFTTISKPALDFPPNNYPNYSTETNLVAKPMEGADYYIMELDTTPNFNSAAFRTDTSSTTTINSGEELYFNKWYYWYFRAVNKYDTSDWSDTWRFQSTSTIFLFKPANKSYNNSNKPHIDFGGIGGATGYQYLLSKDSTFKDVKPISVFGQANTNFDVYAGYGATFYWKARAFHAKDTSPWSATWSFTTKNAPALPAPTLTYPKNNNNTVAPGKVTFTWSSNGINAFSYDFQLSYFDDFSSTIIDTKVPNAFAVVNSMKPAQEYFWRVRSYYDTLVSPWSATAKFTTLQNTGIEDNNTETDLIKIYPNPATQTLYIQASENALLQAYTLMDLNGRILNQNTAEINAKEEKIDISQLKPGMYILHITTANGNIYRRVIKQ